MAGVGGSLWWSRKLGGGLCGSGVLSNLLRGGLLGNVLLGYVLLGSAGGRVLDFLLHHLLVRRLLRLGRKIVRALHLIDTATGVTL